MNAEATRLVNLLSDRAEKALADDKPELAAELVAVAAEFKPETPGEIVARLKRELERAGA